MPNEIPSIPDKAEKQPALEENIDRELDSMEASKLFFGIDLIPDIIKDVKVIRDIVGSIAKYIREKLGGDKETKGQLEAIGKELVEISAFDRETELRINQGLDHMKPEAIRDRITTCVRHLTYINGLFQHPNPKIREWAGQNNDNLSKLRQMVDGRRHTMEDYLAKQKKEAPAPVPPRKPDDTKPPRKPDDTPKPPEKPETNPELDDANALVNICEELSKVDRNGDTGWSKYSRDEKRNMAKKMILTHARMKEMHQDANYDKKKDVIKTTSEIMVGLARYYEKFFKHKIPAKIS